MIWNRWHTSVNLPRVPNPYLFLISYQSPGEISHLTGQIGALC